MQGRVWPQGILGALLVAESVLIPLERSGCRVESAHLEQVDGVVRVLAVLACGGVTCWERWLVAEGQELGVSRVCRDRSGSGLRPAPPGTPP